MARVSADEKNSYLQQRRNQIIEAAIKVLGRDGFDRARVSDIANEAGVAKGTLYNYFDSKEDILSAILTDYALAPQLKALTQTGMSPREMLIALANDYFAEVVDKNPQVVRLVIEDSPRFPDLTRLIYKKLILAFDHSVAEYLNKQAEAGEFWPRKDPMLTARAFFGMLLIYVFSQKLLKGEEIKQIDRQDWVEEVVDIILYGVSREDRIADTSTTGAPNDTQQPS